MKNENIQNTISDMLEGMAEHAIERLGEGLDAMKTKSFVTKRGEILKGEPEVDYAIRLRSVEVWDRLRQKSRRGPAADVLHPSNNLGHVERRKEVVAMTPVDRALLRQAGEIEEKFAEVERQLAKDEDRDGSAGEGQN